MNEMYDHPKYLKDTFNEINLSEYMIQAQWAEFIELKKAIVELYRKKKYALTVLDIGIGNARILKRLVGIKEIWNMIKHYDGIDVAKNCISLSKEVIKKLNIETKANVQLLDAVNLKSLNKEYDLIISTWFTVGNFYPFNFDFKKFKHNYDMSTNDKFTKIFEQAYGMLNVGGEIVIGSVYIDNEKTRKKQEDSYINFGWSLITDERDCFTATKDGWWSQRFTKERVYNYLRFIPREKISFIPLDTYDYAMMIKIKR